MKEKNLLNEESVMTPKLEDIMTEMGLVEIQPKSRQESRALEVVASLTKRSHKKLFFGKLANNELNREQIDLFIEAFFSALDDESIVMIMESDADNTRKRNALEIAIYKMQLEGGKEK